MIKPESVKGYTVRAKCPDCGGVAMWEWADGASAREFGWIAQEGSHSFRGGRFARVTWRMLRCGGCGRAGLGKFHDGGNAQSAVFESFHPRSISRAALPEGVPEGVVKEYREAELCASVGAWRGASALLRSALEKVLIANGYSKGRLVDKIDQAAKDGVLTAARKQMAHEDVRVLGNEIVHDEWREVSDAEVDQSLHYVQRILEDLYDDRAEVEKLLVSAKRLQLEKSPSP